MNVTKGISLETVSLNVISILFWRSMFNFQRPNFSYFSVTKLLLLKNIYEFKPHSFALISNIYLLWCVSRNILETANISSSIYSNGCVLYDGITYVISEISIQCCNSKGMKNNRQNCHKISGAELH